MRESKLIPDELNLKAEVPTDSKDPCNESEDNPGEVPLVVVRRPRSKSDPYAGGVYERLNSPVAFNRSVSNDPTAGHESGTNVGFLRKRNKVGPMEVDLAERPASEVPPREAVKLQLCDDERRTGGKTGQEQEDVETGESKSAWPTSDV